MTTESNTSAAPAASSPNRDRLEFDAKLAELVANATPEDHAAAHRIVDNPVTITVETITPAIAALLYHQTNKHNRDFSLSKAQAFAHEMNLGYWKLIHQGLAFYPNKMLADGQHRLAAVVISGTTQQFTVFRNFAEDAMEAIDLSKRRTAGDAFGITNLVHKNDAKIAGAIVETVMKYEHLRTHARAITPSIYEQKDWAISHKVALEHALTLVEQLVKGDPVLTKAEAGSIALLALIGGHEPVTLTEFLADMFGSIGRYPEAPTLDLYKQFLKSKERSAAKGKLGREEKLALAIRGLTLYCLRQSTAGLRWKKGKDPLPSPVPPSVPMAQAAE